MGASSPAPLLETLWSAILLHHQPARRMKLSVIWVLMVAVGWETIACQKDMFVHQLAILHLLACVAQQMFSVTWVRIQIIAGWETTVCQKDLFVPKLVILHLLVCVAQQTVSVTWVMIPMDAGWETTACQKEVCVLLHVTLLRHPTVLPRK